jgi:inhibitor of KinA sporulation pathway (predicted exonuclease)
MEIPDTLSSAVYLDLEWDCGRRSYPDAGPDIIEIGLAELDPIRLCAVREVNYLVRPKNVDITLQASSITGITRADLVRAPALPEVIAMISREWSAKATCFCWGNDGEILTRACRERQLAPPLHRFVDLSMLFQNIFLLRQQVSVRRALELLDIPRDGGQHMAVIDARNILYIAAEISRRLRSVERSNVSNVNSPESDESSWFGRKLLTSLDKVQPRRRSKIDLEPGKRDDHDADTRV